MSRVAKILRAGCTNAQLTVWLSSCNAPITDRVARGIGFYYILTESE